MCKVVERHRRRENRRMEGGGGGGQEAQDTGEGREEKEILANTITNNNPTMPFDLHVAFSENFGHKFTPGQAKIHP